MNNKEKQLMAEKEKALTWIYFWRNKGLEVLGVLLLIGLIMLLPSIGKLFGCWEKEGPSSLDKAVLNDGVCDNIGYGIQGAAVVVGFVLVILILYIVIQVNWNWAERQAYDKLNPDDDDNY